MAKSRKSYKKRPLWQWIAFYLVIGGIIYSLLYYSGTLSGLKIGDTSNFDQTDVSVYE